MGRIITRATPVGELVPVCGGDMHYPAVEIHLRTDDDRDILLAVVEYDKCEDRLRWVRWPNLNESDSDPVVFSMSKEEVERQIAEVS